MIKDSYYCFKCKHNHYEYGKIGREHIEFKGITTEMLRNKTYKRDRMKYYYVTPKQYLDMIPVLFLFEIIKYPFRKLVMLFSWKT